MFFEKSSTNVCAVGLFCVPLHRFWLPTLYHLGSLSTQIECTHSTELAEKNYHKVVYRRSFVKQQATILLEELILKEAKLQHRLLNQQDTNRAIAQIISKAFDKDQVQELTKYAKAIGF